ELAFQVPPDRLPPCHGSRPPGRPEFSGDHVTARIQKLLTRLVAGRAPARGISGTCKESGACRQCRDRVSPDRITPGRTGVRMATRNWSASGNSTSRRELETLEFAREESFFVVVTGPSRWPPSPTRCGRGISPSSSARPSGRTTTFYVTLDIFSCYVVGWMVAHAESARLTERLIAAASETQAGKT